MQIFLGFQAYLSIKNCSGSFYNTSRRYRYDLLSLNSDAKEWKILAHVILVENRA